MDTSYYVQESATIYGHNVGHYLITCPLGNIHIVQWEGYRMVPERKYFEDNYKAEKYFKRVCNQLLNGKFL